MTVGLLGAVNVLYSFAEFIEILFSQDGSLR